MGGKFSVVFFLKKEEGVLSSIFYFKILILEVSCYGNSSSESITIGFLFFFEEEVAVAIG